MRKDPTPARKDPTPPRKDPTPAPHAVVAETPFNAGPGPLVDPSAWFEDGSLGTPPPAPGQLEVTPVTRAPIPRADFEHAGKTAPRGRSLQEDEEAALGNPFAAEATPLEAQGSSPEGMPSLLGSGGRKRQIVVALVLCIVSGALVGWLISGPR